MWCLERDLWCVIYTQIGPYDKSYYYRLPKTNTPLGSFHIHMHAACNYLQDLENKRKQMSKTKSLLKHFYIQTISLYSEILFLQYTDNTLAELCIEVISLLCGSEEVQFTFHLCEKTKQMRYEDTQSYEVFSCRFIMLKQHTQYTIL